MMPCKKIVLIVFWGFSACAQSLNFEAKGLIYLYDSDFNPFSYSLNQIEKETGNQDKLGAFQFPLAFEESNKNAERAVSNSILRNHKSIVLSKDNKYCYVAETAASLKMESKSGPIKDLNEGSYVSVIDVSNLKNLNTGFRFLVGINPTAIMLNPNGDYLAVGSEAYNQEVQLFELDSAGKPIRIISKPSQMNAGSITDVVWHPSGDYLAYINSKAKEVGLMKVITDLATKKIIRLEVFGNPIKLDGLPMAGLFSNDGKYFYVLDKKGEIGSSDFYDKGQVFSIKFNFDDPLNHFLISKVDIDLNPSSMIMHPSGQNIVVTNVKKSFDYPVNDRNTGRSSLSLLYLMPDGNIVNKTNVNIDGILTTGTGFDKNGKNLAVCSFQFMNYGKPLGGVEFYKFNAGNNPSLEKQNVRINTNKGVHAIKVIENY